MLNPYYGLFQYSRDDIYTLQINPDSAVNPVSHRQMQSVDLVCMPASRDREMFSYEKSQLDAVVYTTVKQIIRSGQRPRCRRCLLLHNSIALCVCLGWRRSTELLLYSQQA